MDLNQNESASASIKENVLMSLSIKEKLHVYWHNTEDTNISINAHNLQKRLKYLLQANAQF